MSDKAIESGSDLYEWMHRATQKQFESKYANKGVMVSSKVRREVLTCVDQGKLLSRGQVVDIKFENIGGGVWRAYVDDFFAMESCTQNAIIYT